MVQLPISAIVVGCNESSKLLACLQSITFCMEIKYIDLESSDESVNIAESLGVEVVTHKRVPLVEIIHHEYYRCLKYKWVLIIDPDEYLTIDLQKNINDLFIKGVPDYIGGIKAPEIYYYKRHALNGTPWGGINYRLLLFNSERYEMTGHVHLGRNLKPSFTDYFIPYEANNIVVHFWTDSFSQLVQKHKRYLQFEAVARYDRGLRTSFHKLLLIPLIEFWNAYIPKNGYKDGMNGLILSLFWSWYQFMAELGLYRYQQKISRK